MRCTRIIKRYPLGSEDIVQHDLAKLRESFVAVYFRWYVGNNDDIIVADDINERTRCLIRSALESF